MDYIFVKFSVSVSIVSVSVLNLRFQNLLVSVSLLVWEKLLGLGLDFDVCGLDYITDF